MFQTNLVTHFWENPYDQTDASFPCTIDRGTADTPMYMMNRKFRARLFPGAYLRHQARS